MNPNKKPRLDRLDEGTSHSKQSDMQATKSLRAVISRVQADMEKSEDTFVYPPLHERYGQDIRVLVIKPGRRDDPVECKLIPSTLPKNESVSSQTPAYPYIALSYYWGEGRPIHPIKITNFINMTDRMQKPTEILEEAAFVWRQTRKETYKKEWRSHGKMHVRSNLFVALKALRERKKEVTVWIDALCINQRDDYERSAQVKNMHELYIQAEKVKIWLGDGSSPNFAPKPCFSFLRKILDLSSLDSLLDNLANGEAKAKKKVMHVVKLMSNTWFSRRWIIQELALAKSAEVVFGKETMPWSDFADSIAIFIKSQERIGPVLSDIIAEEAKYVAELRPIDGVKSLGANALVDFINNLFRRTESGDILQRMMTLESLVSNLLAFEATNPRDTIYAVLSLAKDTHDLSTENNASKPILSLDSRLAPAYENCLLDVYTDFIEYCIEKSNSLDILLRHWAPSEMTTSDAGQEKLPTWIPSIRNSSFGSPSKRIQGRSNGDGFAGTSFHSNQKTYSATLDLRPHRAFEKMKYSPDIRAADRKKRYSGKLFVKGLRIGTIEKTTPRAAQGMIFKEAFELANFDYEWWQECQQWAQEIPRIPDAFWRTIVADRGPDGNNPPSWYPRACLECLNHLKLNGDFSPNEMLKISKISSITKAFADRVKDVVWERLIVRIQLGGRASAVTYGLAPKETMVGDIICVLFGCSVPVVLRMQETAGFSRSFRMIGECFVYGMMDGEAVGDKGWTYPYNDAELFQLE